MSEIDRILTEGLAAGFVGGTERSTVDRGGFKFKTSHFETPDGDRYHDERIGDRVGGGQELVEKVDGRKFARNYLGGTVSKGNLKRMGLTKKDVTGYLKGKLEELGDQTRLFEDCQPDPDGYMQYSYKIIDQELDVPLTIAKEVITWEGNIAFVHAVLLCPVE